MSFGPSNTTKSAINNLGGVSNLAQNTEFPQFNTAGTNMFNLGMNTAAPGTNFFNTVLGGNRANTTAMLQPDIDRIRGNSANTLKAVNTLMPRGGGRYSSQYDAALQPSSEIANLFNPARSSAASALPGIGLQQSGQGLNLFNLANNALGTASGVNSNLAQIGQQQQQMSNSLASNLFGGLFKLASTPFGGGAATNGLLGLI